MPQKANVKYVDADGVINPVSGGVGQAVDGFTIVATDTVLLVHPPNGDAYAGPWTAAAGAWTRATDWGAPADITLGDEWYVESGAEYTGTKWHFDDDAVPTSLNTDLLTISQLTRRRALAQGSGIDISGTTPPVITWTSPSDVQSTFEEGLKVEYLTANSMRIHPGALYIPASGVADLDSSIDLTSLTLTANTWYYLYAYDASGGVLAFDPLSLQRPATPYRGEARVKGGGTGGVLDNTNPDIQPDNTRRFAGVLRATGTNVMAPFEHNLADSSIQYKVSVTQHTGLTATAYNARSLVTMVPPTSTRAYVWFSSNPNSGVAVNLDTTNATSQDLSVARIQSNVAYWVTTDSTQQIYVKNLAASGSTDIQTLGYKLGR